MFTVMNKLAIFQIKSVYGNDMIYPVCANAMLFARLTGKKTFTMNDIETIQALGYIVSFSPSFIASAN